MSVHEYPDRQVRAAFDAETLVVYQAFPPAIADPALVAGTFVPPFKLERMTWIKPSFLWMMYRSGWGTKPGQESVLAVTITREGFEWALANSSLSHHDPQVYPGHDVWIDRKRSTPVRVQWDPERSLNLEPLNYRSIQVGLSGRAVRHYVEDWIVQIRDVTTLARQVREHVEHGEVVGAKTKLPQEDVYPLPDDVRAVVGAS